MIQTQNKTLSHFVYKTSFSCGSYYIGKHSTYNTNDGYLGSGVKLSKLLSEGHVPTFEILAFFDSSDKALLFEKEAIGDKWKTDQFCLNKMPGGKGGFEHISHKGRTKSLEWRKKIGEANRKPRKNKEKVLLSARLGADARRGQKDSPEVNARRAASVSAATKGVPKPHLRKRYSILGTVFVGLKEAAKSLSVSPYIIRTRVNSSDYPDWKMHE